MSRKEFATIHAIIGNNVVMLGRSVYSSQTSATSMAHVEENMIISSLSISSFLPSHTQQTWSVRGTEQFASQKLFRSSCPDISFHPGSIAAAFLVLGCEQRFSHSVLSDQERSQLFCISAFDSALQDSGFAPSSRQYPSKQCREKKP